MPQVEMTLDEKFAIARKAYERLDMGDREGYSRHKIGSHALLSGKSGQEKNKKGVSLYEKGITEAAVFFRVVGVWMRLARRHVNLIWEWNERSPKTLQTDLCRKG